MHQVHFGAPCLYEIPPGNALSHRTEGRCSSLDIVDAICPPDVRRWLDMHRSNVQGFMPASGHEARTYWSRPDVARAHGASSWPTKAPRAGPASQASGRDTTAAPPAAINSAHPP